MKQIPQDHAERLFRKVRNGIVLIYPGVFAIFILAFISPRLQIPFVSRITGVLLVLIFLAGFLSIPVFVISYLSGISLFSLTVRMNNDITGDGMITRLERAARLNFIQRRKILSLLADALIYRGETGRALEVLDRINPRSDRERMGIMLSRTFIYDITGDSVNVTACEDEADAIVERHMNNLDIVKYYLTVSMRIYKARGEYETALGICDRLISLSQSAGNNANSKARQMLRTFALSQGIFSYYRAELLYLMGYYDAAGETLYTAMPDLAHSSFMADKGTQLMMAIQSRR